MIEFIDPTMLVFRLMVVAGITRALLHAEIFDEGYALPIRPWLMSRSGSLGKHLATMLSCPLCTGFWWGMITWCVAWPWDYRRLWLMVPFGFAAAMFAALYDYIVSFLVLRCQEIDSRLEPEFVPGADQNDPTPLKEE